MSITAEEKEALFAEFEAIMLKKKQGYASGYETTHNMENAKDYFWTMYHNAKKNREFNIWSNKVISSADWDMVRKLVCHANGVSIVRSIPPEKLSDANELAMKLLELLFDYNERILDEGNGAV